MVPAADALPAGAHDGEVVLAAEELLWLAAEPVPEVRVVDVPVVQPEALPVEADRPTGRRASVAEGNATAISGARGGDVLDVGLHPRLSEDERIGFGRDDDVQRLAECLGCVL